MNVFLLRSIDTRDGRVGSTVHMWPQRPQVVNNLTTSHLALELKKPFILREPQASSVATE